VRSETLDVAVMGGGPAGCTAATLLADQGFRVALLEREKEPPFKVGESLVPYTYGTFERLGIVERLKRSRFQRKHSVQFFSASGRGSAPFYFSETDPHERSTTWQVRRSEFDALLLDNAVERGVDLRQGVQVQGVVFEGEQAVGVRVQEARGAPVEVPARVVVDATGRSALMARKLALAVPEPHLRKISIFSHFRGARRDPGIDEGATLIMHTRNRDSWFWYIPLAGDIASVGVVGDLGNLLSGPGQAQSRFDREIGNCPALAARLAGAEQALPVSVVQDFSYCAERIAGDGWVLVGDAFAFLDPIYSTGVLLALKSGELAADTIGRCLREGDLSGAALGSFADEFLPGIRAFRKVVYAFYDRNFNFADFLKANPECRQGVIDILSGNVFGSGVESIFGPMERMCRLPEDRSVGAV
jgi:flavin-dependent dehydrogenase